MKMKNNKSNILPGLLIYMLFGIISVVFITSAYFEFAVGNDYIIIPLHNVSNQSYFSSEILGGMDKTVINYQSTSLDVIDNGWFLSFMIISLLGIYIAYQQRQQSYFSWVTMLFIGLTILMFVVGLVSILINWWYNDILLRLFNNLTISIPKFAYYVENFGFIWFIEACFMMLANIVDVNFSTMLSRKKKETDAINIMEGDEII